MQKSRAKYLAELWETNKREGGGIIWTRRGMGGKAHDREISKDSWPDLVDSRLTAREPASDWSGPSASEGDLCRLVNLWNP